MPTSIEQKQTAEALKREQLRLKALRLYNVLDTPPEEKFDRITSTAATALNAPIALVSFIDETRQVLKSQVGWDAMQIPRSAALCAHTIEQNGVFEVTDAAQYARFAANPFVTGAPHIRFYAGAPLTTAEGHHLGALCVMDTTPRTLTHDQRSILKSLSQTVMDLMEHKSKRSWLSDDVAHILVGEGEVEESLQQLAFAFEIGGLGFWDWDRETGVTRFSERWANMLGYRKEELSGVFETWEQLLHPEDAGPTRKVLDQYISGECPDYNVQFRMRHKDGDWRWIASKGKTLTGDNQGNTTRLVGTHEDITPYRVAVDVLQRQNEYMVLAEQVAGVGHWQADLQNGVLWWSDEVYRIYGVSRDQFTPTIGNSVEFYHPDDHNHIANVIETAVRNKTGFDFELRIIRPDGAIRNVSAKAECQLNGAGKVEAIFGIFQDITDRVRAEQELRVSTERYDMAVRGSSVGLWDWDVRTNALYLSPRFQEILGVRHESFAPDLSEFENRLHPDDYDRIMTALKNHLEQKEPYDVEYRLRRGDGSYVWIHARGEAIWDENGAPLRMAGSVDDIDEQIRLRQDNDRQHKQLQLIFDNVPAQIWLKNDANQILRLNEQAADSIGVAVEQAQGSHTSDFFPEMAQKYHEDDLAVIDAGEPKLGVVENYSSRNGQHGWVRTDKVPYTDPDTGEQLVFIVSTDVTEEKIRDDQLRNLNQSLKGFAYTAAHDLQAPARQVDMFLEILAEDMEAAGLALTEEMRESLRGAQRCIGRMRSMIDSLYRLSDLDAGDVTFSHMSLRDVAEGAIESIGHVIEGADAQITVNALPRVFANPDLIGQVLQNLTTNACKYGGKRPHVCVRYERGVATATHRIIVEDNGPGIPPEAKNRIFEPFKRLHHAADADGSGIGLAVCRRIAQLHNGSLTLDTSYREGARFVLELPLSEKGVQA